MNTGRIIIKAVCDADALQTASQIDNEGHFRFVWRANAEEQIEAALNEAGYKVVPIEP